MMRNVPDTATTAADKQPGAVSHPAARQHGAGPRCRSFERPAFHLKHPISFFAFDQREWQRISGSCLRPGAPGSASSPTHRVTGSPRHWRFVGAIRGCAAWRHGGRRGESFGRAGFRRVRFGGHIFGGRARSGRVPRMLRRNLTAGYSDRYAQKKPKTGNVRIEYSIDFLQKGGKQTDRGHCEDVGHEYCGRGS